VLEAAVHTMHMEALAVPISKMSLFGGRKAEGQGSRHGVD